MVYGTRAVDHFQQGRTRRDLQPEHFESEVGEPLLCAHLCAEVLPFRWLGSLLGKKLATNLHQSDVEVIAVWLLMCVCQHLA